LLHEINQLQYFTNDPFFLSFSSSSSAAAFDGRGGTRKEEETSFTLFCFYFIFMLTLFFN